MLMVYNRIDNISLYKTGHTGQTVLLMPQSIFVHSYQPTLQESKHRDHSNPEFEHSHLKSILLKKHYFKMLI